MQVQSDIMPQSPFEIEGEGIFVDVLFYDNIIPKEGQEGEQLYEYELYRIHKVRNRPGLSAAIESNYESWKDMAIAASVANSYPMPGIEDRIAALEEMEIERLMGGAL